MGIAANYAYNMIFQILIVITPFITMPYISRIFGPEGVGIVSFTDVVTRYFAMAATLGISIYGSRSIAYVRNDYEKRSSVFCSIFFLEVFLTVLSSICFLLFLIIFKPKYTALYYILMISLISIPFDVSWFFIGLEQFKKTVTRNVFVKLIGVVSIFIFVKTYNDLWKYILLLALANLFGNLVVFIYLPQYVRFHVPSFKDIGAQFYPMFKLFIPQMIMFLYGTIDKLLLGLRGDALGVGYYDSAKKINLVVLGFATSLGTVMMPRISNIYAEGDIEKIKKYVAKSFAYTTYLIFPITIGLIGITDNFVPWFLGDKFLPVKSVQKILTINILLIAWMDIIVKQLIVPMKKENLYIIISSIMVLLNITLNFMLIPKLSALGTSLAAVIPYFIAIIISVFTMRKYLNWKEIFFENWKFLLSSVGMLIILTIIGKHYSANMRTTILQITSGMLFYFVSLILLKSKINGKIIKSILLLVKQKIFMVN